MAESNFELVITVKDGKTSTCFTNNNTGEAVDIRDLCALTAGGCALALVDIGKEFGGIPLSYRMATVGMFRDIILETFTPTTENSTAVYTTNAVTKALAEILKEGKKLWQTKKLKK